MAEQVDARALKWSGFYAGIYGSTAGTAAEAAGSFGQEPSFGVGGGVRTGYDFTLGPVVFGLAADLTSLDITGGAFDYQLSTVAPSFAGEWMTTLRARAGIDVGPALAFMTTGLGVVQGSYAAGNVEIGGTQSGWAIGGGIEYPVDAQTFVTGQYLYADFDELLFSSGGAPGFTMHNVTVGLAYRF